MEHLYNNHGRITHTMLQDSYTRMTAPYSLFAPIEDLLEQINAAQDLAPANGTGYMDAEIVSIAFALIFQQ
eukprot:7320598-Ditylum_brightwellii.AAC.1